MSNIKQLSVLMGLLIALIINFTLIISIHLSWDTSMKKYPPLQANIKELKSTLSEAHLWLEEAISGDTSVNIQKDVMFPLESKSFRIYVKKVQSEFTDTQDMLYLKYLQDIETKLGLLSNTANKRWLDSTEYGIGSILDQKFDADFNRIINLVDELTVLVKKDFETEIKDRDQYFIYVIIFFLLTNFALLILLYFYVKEQKRYELSLFEEKEKVRVTLQSIGDAVVTTDIYGNITFLNEVAEKLTEHKSVEVEGLHIDIVLDLWNMKSGKKIKTPIHNVLHNNLTKLISNGTKLISKSGVE